MRNLDGEEPIADFGTKAAPKKVARKLHVAALLTAALLTALTFRIK